MNDRDRLLIDRMLNLITDEVANRLTTRATNSIPPAAMSPALPVAQSPAPETPRPESAWSAPESAATASPTVTNQPAAQLVQPATSTASTPALPQTTLAAAKLPTASPIANRLPDTLPPAASSDAKTPDRPPAAKADANSTRVARSPRDTSRGGKPGAAALMARLALVLFGVVVLINLPFNTEGTAIARSIPLSAALVIRDGLVVKEAGSPEIWVYQNGSFRWISSLTAFKHFGYSWARVHIVEAGYLARFEKGQPIYVLQKCDASPHIYRLEDDLKRWIVDIPTFLAEGHRWTDVQVVPCSALRALRDGESVPPGRGQPPPPLP